VPNAQVCVYLTVHITKSQLQTTFPKPLYISHSACIHQDPYISKTSLYITFCMYPSGPWPLKILMFALLVTCEMASVWHHCPMPLAFSFLECPYEIFVQLNTLFCFMTFRLKNSKNITTTKPHHVCLPLLAKLWVKFTIILIRGGWVCSHI
jgi:hypothetical protein